MRISQNHSQNPAADIRTKDRGFTLLEILIAISILTVGLLAVASMQISAMRANSFAGGVTEGTTWTGDQLEKLLALPYDDADLDDRTDDGAAGLDDTGGDADWTEDRGRYTVCWNVAVDAVTNNTKTISVIAIWTDHGVSKRVSIQHIKAR
jgi:type IV pilus assembly protein PilV